MSAYQKSRMNVRLAVKEYMRGATLRADSDELSDKRLAGKFACHVTTIKRVREHMPVTALDDADQALIRECVKEKARIDALLPTLSKTYLCKHYGVSEEAMDIELELAGWEDPRQKRKKQRAAA